MGFGVPIVELRLAGAPFGFRLRVMGLEVPLIFVTVTVALMLLPAVVEPLAGFTVIV